jgi:hypothetical protein
MMHPQACHAHERELKECHPRGLSRLINEEGGYIEITNRNGKLYLRVDPIPSGPGTEPAAGIVSMDGNDISS